MTTNFIIGETWQELGFTSIKNSVGKEYSTCPKCSHTRKKNRLKCVVINHNTGYATCYHTECSAVFKIGTAKGEYNPKDYTPAEHTKTEKVYDKPKMPPLPSEEAMQDIYKWFSERKISKETLQEMQVTKVTMNKFNWIVFPYFRNNELINAKYRNAKKEFRLEKNAELILYNFDVLYTNIKTLIITEGEIDLLTFFQCGIKNVVSVPNGASKNANLSYLDSAMEFLEQIDTFIIATDTDQPGELLAAELTRRLGTEKCIRVTFGDCKDANELVCKYSENELIKIIQDTENRGIENILDARVIAQRTVNLYENGYPKTYKINITSFDDLFSFNLGEVTIVTGGANVGKSTFVNECLQRLNYYHGLKAGILSWEQQPVEGHMGRILQRYYGKTFFEPTQYQNGMQRMTPKERDNGIEYYNENFKFFDCRGYNYGVKDICKIAEKLVTKYGINILYIDPFTHIDKSKKPKGLTDTEFISYIMVNLSNLAKELNLAIILVAHPTKSRTLKYVYVNAKGEDDTIFFGGKNDINGSVHFENTADNIISVGKHPISFNPILFTEKVRYQDFVGKIGETELLFDTKTYRYNDLYNQSLCNYTTKKEISNDTRTATIHTTDFSDGLGDLPF